MEIFETVVNTLSTLSTVVTTVSLLSRCLFSLVWSLVYYFLSFWYDCQCSICCSWSWTNGWFRGKIVVVHVGHGMVFDQLLPLKGVTPKFGQGAQADVWVEWSHPHPSPSSHLVWIWSLPLSYLVVFLFLSIVLATLRKKVTPSTLREAQAWPSFFQLSLIGVLYSTTPRSLGFWTLTNGWFLSFQKVAAGKSIKSPKQVLFQGYDVLLEEMWRFPRFAKRKRDGGDSWSKWVLGTDYCRLMSSQGSPDLKDSVRSIFPRDQRTEGAVVR